MSRTIAVGIFTLSALLILIAGVFIIGERKLLFTETYQVVTEFPDVAGLDSGAEVRVGGLRRGTVKQIRLPQRPDRQITVVMSVDLTTRPLIRRDSIATIKTEGLLGNKYVEISFGSVEAAPIRDGDRIQGLTPADYADLLQKANNVIDQTGQALTDTQTALKTVNRIGKRVESITSKIDRGEGTIGALVNDPTLYNRANQILSDAQGTTQTLRAASEDLSQKASEITSEAKDAVTDIRRTTSTIEQNTGPIIAEARKGVGNFNENMEALKHNWFFKRFFKNRGYFDLAKLTENEISQVPADPYEKILIPSDKLFDKSDNADLKKKKELKKIGRRIEQSPPAMVVISAYAGEKGAADENLELTRAQAGVVRQFLIDNFRLDEKSIFTKGFGETLGPRGYPPRRVEIFFYHSQAQARPSSLTQ